MAAWRGSSKHKTAKSSAQHPFKTTQNNAGGMAAAAWATPKNSAWRRQQRQRGAWHSASAERGQQRCAKRLNMAIIEIEMW
jgi:hypothetical protein